MPGYDFENREVESTTDRKIMWVVVPSFGPEVEFKSFRLAESFYSEEKEYGPCKLVRKETKVTVEVEMLPRWTYNGDS